MIWTLLLMGLLALVNLLLGLLPLGEPFPPEVGAWLATSVGFIWSWSPIFPVALALRLFALTLVILLIELVIMFVRFLLRPHKSGQGPG